MRDNERFSSAEGGSRMLGALLVVAFVIAIGPLAVLYGRERESTATAARSSRRRTPATRRRICSGQALRRSNPATHRCLRPRLRTSAPETPMRLLTRPARQAHAGLRQLSAHLSAGDGFLVAARALGLGLPRQVAGLVPARRQLAHLHRAVLRVDAAATTRVPGYDVRTRIARVAVVHRHGV